MSTTNIGLMDAIDIAMEAELKARQFYRDALSRISSERGKNLLEQLADFENNHYNTLQKLKNSLSKSDTFIEYAGTEFKPYTQSGQSEVSGKIEPNKNEVLNILSMAIEAETEAALRYRELAKQTGDSKGKDMFKRLSEEETLHRRILSDEFYQLNNRGELWFWGD